MSPRKTKRNDGRFAFPVRYVDLVTGVKRRAYFYGKTQAEARAKADQARPAVQERRSRQGRLPHASELAGGVAGHVLGGEQLGSVH